MVIKLQVWKPTTQRVTDMRQITWTRLLRIQINICLSTAVNYIILAFIGSTMATIKDAIDALQKSAARPRTSKALKERVAHVSSSLILMVCLHIFQLWSFFNLRVRRNHPFSLVPPGKRCTIFFARPWSRCISHFPSKPSGWLCLFSKPSPKTKYCHRLTRMRSSTGRKCNTPFSLGLWYEISRGRIFLI